MNDRVAMMAVLGLLGLCSGCMRVTEIASPPERLSGSEDVGDYGPRFADPFNLSRDDRGLRIRIGPRPRRTSCLEGGWIVTYRYVDFSSRPCALLPRDPRLHRGYFLMPQIQQGHWKTERLAVSYEELARRRRTPAPPGRDAMTPDIEH